MIKRELGIFLIVGILATLVDFTIYRGLLWWPALDVDIAKVCGFLTGTLFAYFANRFWTFNVSQHKEGTAWRFAVLYATTLSVNVLANSAALKLNVSVAFRVQIAFLFATALSAILNFIGMKFFVFKHRPESRGV